MANGDDIAYPAPDPERPYVYPGTTVLINRFGIHDQAALDRVVSVVAGLRGAELDRKPVPGGFDLAHLCAIHHYLFQDVYAWAGVPRTVDTVKLTRTFAPAARIAGEFAALHDELRQADFLRGLAVEEFAGRLAEHYMAIYAIHPFREGNSRALRHHCTYLATAAGHRLDFSSVPLDIQLAEGHKAHFGADRAIARTLLLQAMVSG